ncbi:hypothetical protein V865_004170 [Kwoniella europaea PYCC6329]|uniref:Uncharacterized protein n=1 Tax=Kwoniella europaea PYCC6329 TaxID=1423913 RepID=A0AAX4KKD3_9TREE
MTTGNDPAGDLSNSERSGTPTTFTVGNVTTSTQFQPQAGSQAETSAGTANQTTSSSGQSKIIPRDFMSAPPRTGSSKTGGFNILDSEFDDGR